MNVPDGLKYTESHEWLRQEGEEVVVGISDYAQHELTDIVFVELPEVDSVVEAGDAICVVESTKVAADVYAPVSGTVIAVNEDLADNPQWVNESPYEKGWLFRIAASDLSPLDGFRTAAEYRPLVEE
jgi:glycine cleavage system H protein